MISSGRGSPAESTSRLRAAGPARLLIDCASHETIRVDGRTEDGAQTKLDVVVHWLAEVRRKVEEARTP